MLVERVSSYNANTRGKCSCTVLLFGISIRLFCAFVAHSLWLAVDMPQSVSIIHELRFCRQLALKECSNFIPKTTHRCLASKCDIACYKVKVKTKEDSFQRKDWQHSLTSLTSSVVSTFYFKWWHAQVKWNLVYTFTK